MKHFLCLLAAISGPLRLYIGSGRHWQQRRFTHRGEVASVVLLLATRSRREAGPRGCRSRRTDPIRTKSRELQFAGLESDRAKQRGCLPDYLLKFRAPGENEVRIDTAGQVSRNEWIQWAESCWSDILETDTLNVKEGRGDDDTKHICPLQLEVIRRLVLLYTNPGEIVFSPFTGIGSEGYVSLGGKSPKTGKRILDARRFYGCELKREYHEAATANLTRAINQSRDAERTLFSLTAE